MFLQVYRCNDKEPKKRRENMMVIGGQSGTGQNRTVMNNSMVVDALMNDSPQFQSYEATSLFFARKRCPKRILTCDCNQ
ncbi:hypothetical protein L6452_08370 [Arctium lappa]|uniref:Uncharacterized protein n=1 Tax=Arctium lappa TaxID=4217 RepID=A0ACB9DHB3_ARCLA|nr:hypothetical protein L6452_08370 [Arctium lappa]